MKICLLKAMALMVSALGVAAQQTAFKPDCSQSANDYRLSMVNLRGLELLQTPNTTTGKCGQEWSDFGTCCKVDQLTKFINEDTVQISAAVSKLSVEFTSTLEFLNKIFIPNLTAVVLKLKSSNWNTVSQEEVKALEQLLGAPELVYLMEIYKEGQNSGAPEKFKICWDYQASLRAKAICSTCSANSKRFFYRQKGIVKEDICNVLITNCIKSVFKMNRLINAYQRLYINQGLLEKVGIIINTKEKMRETFNDAFKQYQSPLFEEKSLQSKYFIDFKYLLDTNKTMRDTYCEYMTRLNLASTPYIVSFADQIISNVPWRLTLKTGGILLTSTGSVPMLKSTLLSSSGPQVFDLSDLFNFDVFCTDIVFMANDGIVNDQTAPMPCPGSQETMLLGVSFP